MWLGGILTRLKCVIVIIALASICIPVFGQITASEWVEHGWVDQGMFLYNQGKYAEAIGAFDKAIELNPQYAEAWCWKGLTLGLLGKYDEATQACDKAIELDSEYAPAWYGKGNALYNQGKYDEALQAHDKAIQIAPNYADAWNGKGLCLKLLGKTSESNAAFAKAKELGYPSPATDKKAAASRMSSKPQQKSPGFAGILAIAVLVYTYSLRRKK
jgi:tetratricopeptide (TPR) repeat protein